jgi:hypothetical protein
MELISQADYDTSAGVEGMAIGIYKMAVTYAEEGDKTMLRLITKMVNAIKRAEGKMELHKVGIGKMLWKKKGNKEPGNLRPVTLHNAIGKITSKIIADRLTRELTNRHLLHRANEGFLIGRGTNNAIHSILNVFEDSKEFKKPCYCMMYDVSGAFDRITHEQIRRGMEILHLPEHTQNYIMNKLTGGTYTIKTGHGNTEPFEVKRGCPQGCPLSPIIYIIAMNPLHEGLERNPLYGGGQRRIRNDKQTPAGEQRTTSRVQRIRGRYGSPHRIQRRHEKDGRVGERILYNEQGIDERDQIHSLWEGCTGQGNERTHRDNQSRQPRGRRNRSGEERRGNFRKRTG